ncbi:MAG: ABC transporter substrate-binding protein [Lachnospiraceae bacterium]|nr:ABC transporter substrate-binding protein [Lachnospiraceae bacterium]
MKKKTGMCAALSLTAAIALTGCNGNTPDAGQNVDAGNDVVSDNTATDTTVADGGSEGGILYAAANFAYSSLDPHKEYYAWYDTLYGMTESLFVMGDDFSVVPKLAESGEISDDGLTWTIVLKDNVTFSNGNSLNADMAVKNLERLAEINERFSYFDEFEMEVVDDKTFTITTPDVYPTMLNDLAYPEFAMIDVDNTEDFDAAPVCTGPFKIKSFEPEGTVEVEKNENYWDGNVNLDGAVFYYMQDADAKSMAMINGEIQAETGATSSEIELYNADPDKYALYTVPATRLQFYLLNENTLDDEVREAVNLIVDNEEIASFLGGTTTPAVGPFSADSAYGKVTKPAVDVSAATAALEGAGYTLNADGFYEKDGKELDLNICYYASRSLDTCAIVMQEELGRAGIKSHLTVEEDPDATYLATGDFDIALYCMIADRAGDPYYFLNSTLREGSYYDVCGFDSDECEKLLDELKYETDNSKRAELANKIVQIAIDDNAFGYIGLFNKTTVLRDGVTGYGETSPFDFYGLTADTSLGK